jgi:hypothetical protein
MAWKHNRQEETEWERKQRGKEKHKANNSIDGLVVPKKKPINICLENPPRALDVARKERALSSAAAKDEVAIEIGRWIEA